MSVIDITRSLDYIDEEPSSITDILENLEYLKEMACAMHTDMSRIQYATKKKEDQNSATNGAS